MSEPSIIKKINCVCKKKKQIVLAFKNSFIIGGYQAFTNYSVGLPLDPQNTLST